MKVQTSVLGNYSKLTTILHMPPNTILSPKFCPRFGSGLNLSMTGWTLNWTLGSVQKKLWTLSLVQVRHHYNWPQQPPMTATSLPIQAPVDSHCHSTARMPTNQAQWPWWCHITTLLHPPTDSTTMSPPPDNNDTNDKLGGWKESGREHNKLTHGLIRIWPAGIFHFKIQTQIHVDNFPRVICPNRCMFVLTWKSCDQSKQDQMVCAQ